MAIAMSQWSSGTYPGELEVPFGSGVQRPADISPEIGMVDVAVVQGFERRQLIAVKPAKVAALAEAVIGDRAGFGPQALRFRSLELRQ